MKKLTIRVAVVLLAMPLTLQSQNSEERKHPHTPAASQPTEEYKPTPEEAELIRLSREWMDAAIARDWGKLDAIMAPEFTLQAWDATRRPQPRDQWMEALRTRLKDWKIDFTAMSARVFGDFAVVYSRYRWAGALDGQPFEDGGLMVDVWQRRAGRWMVVARRSAGQQQIEKVRLDLADWKGANQAKP
ncbi:MAG: nuclear transport factor 2 family protein [Terriglobales bacterium]